MTRTLTALLLGVPGFMMLLVGCGASVLTSAFIAKGSIPLLPAGFVALAIWTGVASTGFLMFSFVEILSGKARYQIHGRHVPASLALDLASLLSVCSVLCTLVAATSAVTSRQAAWPWFAALVISVLLVSAVLRIRIAIMRKWREESPEADRTQHPLQPAKSVNSMPRVVRWIAFLLIGLPGGIVWLAGVAVLFATLANALGGEVDWLAIPFGLLVGALLAIVGFAMMAADGRGEVHGLAAEKPHGTSSTR